MNGIRVNIFDVLHAHGEGGEAPKFRNVKALADYSYATNQIFPKHIAKGGALKFLLKGIAEKCGVQERVSLEDVFKALSMY